jgi:hypothetical protein
MPRPPRPSRLPRLAAPFVVLGLVSLLGALVPDGGSAQVRKRPPARTPPPDSLPTLTPAYGTTDTARATAKPLSLREIIERCVQGERTKLGGHADMTYTLTVRALTRWKKRKEVRDIVHRIYADASGYSRTVQLGESVHKYKLKDGEWVVDTDESESKGRVRVESDGYSDFVEMPFFLEEQREFDFELLGRTIEVDHVIFKIGFKPKSSFKALPSGVVYVDTDAYRIIHEEFEYDANPFPMFIKDIGRISRHWEQLPGGEWVFTKIMMEVDLRGAWTGVIPEHAAVALHRDNFEFDTGYDARTFGER